MDVCNSINIEQGLIFWHDEELVAGFIQIAHAGYFE